MAPWSCCFSSRVPSLSSYAYKAKCSQLLKCWFCSHGCISGSQTIVFKYPSLPKADSASPMQFDDETPAIFWSKDGIVLGRIADISAPVRSGELLLKTGDPASLGLMFDSIQEWSSRNLSEPVRHIAIAQSLNKQSLNFSQIAEVIEMFEKINLKLFNTEGVVPSVVPVELANPL